MHDDFSAENYNDTPTHSIKLSMTTYRSLCLIFKKKLNVRNISGSYEIFIYVFWTPFKETVIVEKFSDFNFIF